jgi:hypothetical protein
MSLSSRRKNPKITGGGGKVGENMNKGAESVRRRKGRNQGIGEYVPNSDPTEVQGMATQHANVYRGLEEATSQAQGIKLSEGARVFPAHYLQSSEGEKDIQDRVMAARMMADAVKGDNTVVTVAPDEKMLKYIRNKDEMLWWMNFERFLEEQYINSGDLSKRDWLRKNYPQYFTMREELIDNQLDIERRVARLKLHGPQDIEDAFLEYLINTDQIKLPTTPVWNTERNAAQTEEAYKRGLLNMRRSFTDREKLGGFGYTPTGPWARDGKLVGPGATNLWTGGEAATVGRTAGVSATDNPFRRNWNGSAFARSNI